MNSTQENRIVATVAKEVKKQMLNESTGHDWWHVLRVWNNAKLISKNGKANSFVINLAAILHDLDDHKFKKNKSDAPIQTIKILTLAQVPVEVEKQVVAIIKSISFKGGSNKDVPLSIEGKVVQDADRLDALGAIGIARAFATGAHFKQSIHNPDSHINYAKNLEQVLAISGTYEKTSINHFYEKLFLIRKLMHTKQAKKIAKKREAFMKEFLKQFYAEWDGKR